jgi:hypothetical protein
VTGGGRVFLHFVELAGLDRGEGVLLTVNGSRLQRRVEFRERQRHGVGAERREGVDEDRDLNHADLEAFDVLHLIDRALGGGEVPEPVVPIAKPDQPLRGQHVEQFGADGPVHDRVDFMVVVEEERQVEDREFLDQTGQQAGAHQRHIEHAAL